MSKDTEKKTGRPSALTVEVLDKLHMAFSIGASNREAAAFAEIAQSTLQLHIKNNEEFSEQVDRWKQTATLQARQVVFKAIKKGDKALAWSYLQAKCKDEFGKRVEMTGADGKDLPSLQVEFAGVDKDD